MSICPKCGKEPERNNSREYLLENRRGRVTTEKYVNFAINYENCGHLGQ